MGIGEYFNDMFWGLKGQTELGVEQWLTGRMPYFRTQLPTTISKLGTLPVSVGSEPIRPSIYGRGSETSHSGGKHNL